MDKAWKFKVGDLVRVKSGKVYRITFLRDAATYRDSEDCYSATQIRDGKAYGPSRVFKEKALTLVEGQGCS